MCFAGWYIPLERVAESGYVVRFRLYIFIMSKTSVQALSSPPSSPFSLFHKTVRERVDKFFKENNIVSLQHTHPHSPLLICMTPDPGALSAGPKDQLLDVLPLLCLLCHCQLFLVGNGEVYIYIPESVCVYFRWLKGGSL